MILPMNPLYFRLPMPIFRHFINAFATLAVCLSVYAQPTLTQVWARHDQFVMSAKAKPMAVDPACSSTFQGKRGQIVRGWDVGPKDAPVVLSWGGGPGDTLLPEYLPFSFGNPLAFRHLMIDQPGTGKSSWLPRWKPEDTIDDAIEFMRLRGIDTQVFVNGWSWGSTMALLFAQRHPERVRGIVVGGVWTNTPEEVRYYLDATGPRAWMPGLSAAFRAFSNGRGTACNIHRAIREGRGGAALPKAYQDAEFFQCYQGPTPRKPLLEVLGRTEPKPVDMATETDEVVRFAYIESEMMCRGQRGEWRLQIRFPEVLSKIPLVVIQGRYDQVCIPEVAQKVLRAWPGARKLFVPFNGGHWFFFGPDKEARTRAELNLNAEQEERLRKAICLDFGSEYLIGAAIDCLVNPVPPQ